MTKIQFMHKNLDNIFIYIKVIFITKYGKQT